MPKWLRWYSEPRTVALVFAVVVLVWLGFGAGRFLYDRGNPETPVDITAASLHELEVLGERTYGVLGGDPQFIFSGIDTSARRLVLRVRFEKSPGEMALYYTRTPEEAFSDRRRVFAVPRSEGVWEYSLPAGHIASLRLDPGNTGTNIFTVEAVTLNGMASWNGYFLPNLRQVFSGLFIGTLASCLICIIMRGYQAVYLRGRSIVSLS